jgi:hypothetical protein
VEADFEAFVVVEYCEESADSVSALVPCLGVEESRVYEPPGDPFVPREPLLVLEASQVRELSSYALQYALCVLLVVSNRPHESASFCEEKVSGQIAFIKVSSAGSMVA